MVDLGNLAKFTNLAYAMMTARHWPWVAARNSCKEEFNREGRNADGPRATRFIRENDNERIALFGTL
jgi:hypothetical protein